MGDDKDLLLHFQFSVQSATQPPDPVFTTWVSLRVYLLDTLKPSMRMCLQFPVITFALVVAVQAIPTRSRTNMDQRSTIDTRSEAGHLSTEAIIGIVGVVVALFGIASSLAWSKRRKSRSRSRRTSEELVPSNYPTHGGTFTPLYPIDTWTRTAGNSGQDLSHEYNYHVHYERLTVQRSM
ncbi:hypothetical protein CUC08_Gglean007505 [Alternaria sp. MG1]|nr:hypothetical protein CUC08_Gglean007505 [Alternaria sp. MG1]